MLSETDDYHGAAICLLNSMRAYPKRYSMVEWEPVMRRALELPSEHSDVTRLVLRHGMGVRLGNFGLSRWRLEIMNLIRTMPGECSYELKAGYIRCLFERLGTLAIMERTSLLELALWKINCLRGDGRRTFKTIQEIRDAGKKDENFDAEGYLKACRITCKDEMRSSPPCCRFWGRLWENDFNCNASLVTFCSKLSDCRHYDAVHSVVCC